MIARRMSWPRLAGTLLVVMVLLVLPGAVLAEQSVTVLLDPVSESGVSGTVVLEAEGDGTRAAVDIQGLAPAVDARATMQAGTCDMPSASFATLPDLQADAAGKATATGFILFRGTEPVALETMADGEHIIAIHAGDQVVACGVIPALATGTPPEALPVTGGALGSLSREALGVLGFCALAGVLLMRLSRRPGC